MRGRSRRGRHGGHSGRSDVRNDNDIHQTRISVVCESAGVAAPQHTSGDHSCSSSAARCRCYRSRNPTSPIPSWQVDPPQIASESSLLVPA
jgi:hypothetical protein